MHFQGNSSASGKVAASVHTKPAGPLKCSVRPRIGSNRPASILGPAAVARFSTMRTKRRLSPNKSNLGIICKNSQEPSLQEWLDSLSGVPGNYRRKARLGIRLVPKKGGILIGFRERGKSYITSLQQCHVLDSAISDLLPDLHDLVGALSCPDRIPQIEVAAGDDVVSLVFRHLVELTGQDFEDLVRFAAEHRVQVYLQPEGLDSIRPLSPVSPVPLHYSLPDHDVRIEFEPTDFVQVNAGLNNMLVELAIHCLDPRGSESILDLFCGLGNFTLPIARRASTVLGVEGDRSLVDRARNNADRNELNNVRFSVTDLYAEAPAGAWSQSKYDKVLLDPPRTGAVEVVKSLDVLAPSRVVYISCNPATLARQVLTDSIFQSAL